MPKFKLNKEELYRIACEIRGWEEWPGYSHEYQYTEQVNRSGFSDGELEQAASLLLGIPEPATSGFVVREVTADGVLLLDLEDANACDITDPDDAHLVSSVVAFREWVVSKTANAATTESIGVTTVAKMLGVSKMHVSQSAIRAEKAKSLGKQYRGQIPAADIWIEGHPFWYKNNIAHLKQKGEDAK
jgi:hypothetical protein